MPRSRAALAMTGAAPVPVPPHDFGHARARLSDNGAPARHGERGEQTAPLSYPLPCPGSGGCSGGSVWLQPPNAPQILAWSTGAVLHPHRANRSEERRVGKESVSTGRNRGSRDHYKKKKK